MLIVINIICVIMLNENNNIYLCPNNYDYERC